MRFACRLDTPFSRLKTAEDHVVLDLMLLAEGCNISVLIRCSGHCEATIARWLDRMENQSSLLRNLIFRDLILALVQMDELYCRVCCTGKMWSRLAIDPITKILPFLHSMHLGYFKSWGTLHHEFQH